MKILYLVRSYDPFWSNRIDVDYIIKELIARGHQVDVYDIRKRMLIDCNNNKRSFKFKNLRIIDFFPVYLLFNFFVFWFFLLKNKEKYAVCQILYVREEQLILHYYIRKVAKKIVLSYYGGDFNRRNFIKDHFQNLVQSAAGITFTSISMLNKFNKYYNNCNPDKIKRLMFPQIRLIGYTNYKAKDKCEFKIKLGISTKKIIITLGTNSDPNEQHFHMLSELGNLSDKDKFYFLIPLTYGGTKEYEFSVINFASTIFPKNNYKIFSGYLSEEEIISIRMATDIFVNLRLRDQLASSMAESFMAYNMIIAGSWLPYGILQGEGFEYYQISSFSEVSTKIEQLSSLKEEEYIEMLNNNRRIVERFYDVSQDLKAWVHYLEEYLWKEK